MDENESSIQKARRALYSKQSVKRTSTKRPRQAGANVREDWATPQAEPRKKQKKLKFSTLFLIGSVTFFILALALSAFLVITGNGRTISPSKLVVAVDGESALDSGDTMNLVIKVTNKNPISVPYADITISFPDGTLDENKQPLTRVVKSIGPLKPGGENEILQKAIVFGEEGSNLSIPISIEYRTDKSNAIIVKDLKHDFIISSAPISMSFSGDTSVVSGNNVEFNIDVRANSKETVPGVGVTIDTPFGFTLLNTEGAPFKNGVFDIGDMQPGEEKELVVRGALVGQEGEDRAVKVTLGTLNASGAIGVSFDERPYVISIEKPLLAIKLLVNNEDTKQSVVSPGDRVSGSIEWKNELDSQIFDGSITVVLSGDAFDGSAVSYGGGLYQQSAGKIVFSRETNPELATIDPGERGVINFSFVPKTEGAQNPRVNIKANISGKRIGDGNYPEPISASSEHDVLIQTDINLSSGASYVSGPTPPTPGKETVYTVNLSINPGISNVADGEVTMTLPSFARYTGTVSPASAELLYSDLNRTLTWKAGELSANTSKNISFQIGITPTTSQINKAPSLIDLFVVSGFDRFTQANIRKTFGALRTNDIVSQ